MLEHKFRVRILTRNDEFGDLFVIESPYILKLQNLHFLHSKYSQSRNERGLLTTTEEPIFVGFFAKNEVLGAFKFW